MKRYFGTDWVRNLFGNKADKSPKRRRRRLTLENLEERLSPATRIWDGGAGVPNWSNPVNWVNNVAPNPLGGDSLVFPDDAAPTNRATVNDLAANTRFTSITFGGSNYTLGGSQVVLSSGAGINTTFVIANLGSTNNTINLNLSISGAAGSRPFFSVGTFGATLAVNGQLVGGSGVDLSKDGVGTLILGGNNSTFVGAFTVTNGNLRIRNAGALGTPGAATTVQFNAQLQVDSVAGAIREPLRLNGAGAISDGALLNFAGNNVWSGNITLDNDSTIGALSDNTAVPAVPSTLTLQGVISDTGTGRNLTKEGTGTVILDPLNSPRGNTYRGKTVVNAGALAIRHSRALGDQTPAPDPLNPGRWLNDTVVNSFPDRSGTLRLDFVRNPARIDPGVINKTVAGVVTPIGFTVPLEQLTLNGPGVNGIHVLPKTLGFPGTTVAGALNNNSGNNTWTQDIALWTDDGAIRFDPLYWSFGTVGIGAEAGTQLTLAGHIIDPYITGGIEYSLIKTRPGRVVFVEDNSYRGRTEVLDGYLNIRDSQALGATGGEENGTIVFPGGTLELETDNLIDSLTPNLPPAIRGTHLPTDLVIGDEAISLMGTGAGGTGGATGNGALRNLLGTNEIRGDLPLETVIIRGDLVTNTGAAFLDRGAWIGVEPDRPPHSRFLLSQLTISGAVGNDLNTLQHDTVRAGRTYNRGYSWPSDLFKTGAGELVLSADNTYTGATYVRQGWITARNNTALGAANTAFGDADQVGTHVAPGAAVVLGRTPAGASLDNVQENFWLAGDGITHRYSELNHKGALLNLSGDNKVQGDVHLINVGAFDLVGIGVGLDPLLPANTAATQESELTILGPISETPIQFRVARASSNQLPPILDPVPPFGLLAMPQAGDAGIAEDRYLIDLGSVSGALAFNVAFVGTNSLQVFYQGQQIGNLNFTVPTPNPTNIGTNANPFRGTLNVTVPVGNDTFVEVVMNPGQPADKARRWRWDALVTPTSRTAGLVKAGLKRLNLAGQGTFGGAVRVTQGVVRAQSDTALGVVLARNPTGATPGSPGLTTVLAGAAFEVKNALAGATGGIGGGIQLNENLSLVGKGVAEVQRVTVAQSPGTRNGFFRLRFGNLTTTPLVVNATAAQVRNALNAILGANTVVVTLAADPATASNVYTITFVRAATLGVDQPQFTTVVGNGATAVPGTVINGNVQTLTNVAGDNAIRGAVTLGGGEAVRIDTRRGRLTTDPLEVDRDSRLAVWGNVSGPGAIIKSGTGKLILGGNNSYAGTTTVQAGVLTAASPTALGLPGSTPGLGGTVIANNAQLETLGDITIAGEAVQVLGDGPDQALNVPLTWFSRGPNTLLANPNTPAATPDGQTNGVQNITGRVTGVVTDPMNPNIIYVSTASGGAWRTRNGGLTWEPLIDRIVGDAGDPIDLQVLYTGTIAVAPSEPNVLYVGLGNATGSMESYYGTGVLKSTDYGETWTRLQEPNSFLVRNTVSKIVVDPTESQIIYIAVQGAGVNTEETAGGFGIWRYDDRGGRNTWTNLTRAAVPPPGNGAFVATDVFSDLIVIDADPFRSEITYPLLSPFANPCYYNAPQQRFIAFAIGNPSGDPRNGIYGAFLEDFADTFVGGPFFSTNPDAGWVIANDIGGAEDLATPCGRFPTAPRYGSIKLTAVRPLLTAGPDAVAQSNLIPEGRLDRRITVYATVSYPVDLARECNDQDGELRTVRRFTTEYNTAPNVCEWPTGGYGDMDNINPGTNSIFGGTDLPVGPNENVPGNQTGGGWYTGALAVSPFERSVVFLGGVGQPYSPGPFLTSASAITTVAAISGQAFVNADIGTKAGAPHVNYHSATFDSRGRVVVGTDGGVWRFTPSSNVLDAAATGTWENLNGNFLQIQEFNGIDVHPFDPFTLAGAALSNGVSVYNGTSWQQTANGHGGQVRIHNRNPNILFASRDNAIIRSLDGGRTWTTIHQTAFSKSYPPLDGTPPQDWLGNTIPYQFNEPNQFPYLLPPESGDGAGFFFFPRDYTRSANYPFVLDPANPSRLLVVQRDPRPGNITLGDIKNHIDVLMVSTTADRAGQPTFVTISNPDDFTGGSIIAIGLANLEGEARRFDGTAVVDPEFDPTSQFNGPDAYDPGTIYVLMSDRLLVTKNGGTSWQERSSDLPTGTDFVAPLKEYNGVTVDPRNRDRAYVTRHVFGGEQVWRTEDGGQTWQDITGNLPDMPAWTLEVNTRNGDLYVGTDNGVFRLTGDNNRLGQFDRWVRLGEGADVNPAATGLPAVQVRQLVFNATTNTLTAGTFGRGAYQLFLEESIANGGGIRGLSGSSVIAGNITLPGPTRFHAEAGAQVNILGSILETPGANFTITKTGLGRVIFSGPSNFGGLVDIQQGVLAVRSPTALGKASPSAASPSKTLVQAGAALELQSDLILERVEVNGNGIKFNGVDTGALRSRSNINTFTGILVLKSNSTIGVDSGSALTIGSRAGLVGAGTITDEAGTFGFSKELTGSLTLTGNNTYEGLTTIKQGAVVIATNRSLGGPTIGTPAQRAAAGTVVETGGQLVIPGTLTVTDENLTLSGTGIFDTGALRITGTANNQWTGTVRFVTMGNGLQAGINVTAGVFTLPNPVDGTGGLRKVGAGRLLLPVNNTYDGKTTVAGGSLEIRMAGALGDGGTAANGTELATGGTLLINPTPEVDLVFTENLNLFGGTLYNFRGNNTWNGLVTLQGAASIINVETNKTLTMTGAIGDTGGSNPLGGVTKKGTGRLILTGTKSYRGDLVIDEGLAQVDGGVGAGLVGNVKLTGGSLYGKGTVGSVGGTGSINPGDITAATPTGILRTGGGVWTAGTTFVVNLLGSATPGVDYDQLVVDGTLGNLNLGNARLMVAMPTNAALNVEMTIIQVSGGTGRLTGGFAGMADNTTFLVGTQRFRIKYTTTTVTLTREA